MKHFNGDGKVSISVKNSQVGRETPNTQTNRQMSESCHGINVFRFTFYYVPMSPRQPNMESRIRSLESYKSVSNGNIINMVQFPKVYGDIDMVVK